MDDAAQTYSRNFSDRQVPFARLVRVLIEEEIGVTHQHNG
jgi:hypothetical protein